MRLIPLVLLIPLISLGQKMDFKGVVKDARTKDPIPYVNISFLNTLIGTSTDENGTFILEVEKELLSQNVHVSSLGYRDSITMAKSMVARGTFYLREEVYDLKEVIIEQNMGDAQVWNPISSYSVTSGFDSSSTPWILALYFPNIGTNSKYVEKVSVFFQDNPLFKRDNAKFRLRLYAVDPVTNAPGKDLVQESLILEANKNENFVVADFSEQPLSIPRNGIYVGLEWLFIPYNWYKKEEMDNLIGTKKIEDRFAPTFGGVYSKNANHRAMVYGMGHWRDFKVRSKDNTGYLIPAVSLKIRQND